MFLKKEYMLTLASSKMLDVLMEIIVVFTLWLFPTHVYKTEISQSFVMG